MTDDEYAAWLRQWFRMFPDFYEWFKKKDAEVQVSLKQGWQQVFADHFVTAREAAAATQMMFAGDADAVPAWEKSLMAANVMRAVREVRRIRSEREAKQYVRRESERTKQVRRTDGSLFAQVLGPYGLGPAFREIESRVAKGEDRKTVTTEIAGQVRRGER